MSAKPAGLVSLAGPVYAPTLLLSVAAGVLVPTLPLYARSFGASYTEVSLVVAAAGLGTVLGDVPAGMLLERHGRKPVMVAGTVVLALATVALVALRYFPMLVLLRLLAGAATAMWNISRMAYLTEVVPVRDRGRALSTFGGVQRIGTFIGPAIGGAVAQAADLTAPFYLAAAISAGAAAISVLFVRESRQRAAPAHAAIRWQTIGALLSRRRRELATAGSAQVFAQMIRSGRQLIVPLVGESLGLQRVQIGTIVSVSSAVDMMLFLPAGLIMDRLGRKFAAVPSFLVLALGMALVPFARSYTSLLFAGCVMGLGNGIGAGTMMTLGADLSPREATGEFLGVWRLVGDAGQVGGPLIVGTLADLVGLPLAATGLAGVGVLAATTLLLFVRETLDIPGRRAHEPARASSRSIRPP